MLYLMEALLRSRDSISVSSMRLLMTRIGSFMAAYREVRSAESGPRKPLPKLHHIEYHLVMSAAFFPPRFLSNETQEAANRYVRDMYRVLNFKSPAKNAALKLSGRVAARIITMDSALMSSKLRLVRAKQIGTKSVHSSLSTPPIPFPLFSTHLAHTVTGDFEKYVITQLTNSRLIGFPVLPPALPPRKMPTLSCRRGAKDAWQSAESIVQFICQQLDVEAEAMQHVRTSLLDCQCRRAKSLHIDTRLVREKYAPRWPTLRCH